MIGFVPAAVGVQVRVAGRLAHRCPYVDEVDVCQVTVEWTTTGTTFELHSLAGYLQSFSDVKVSNEDLADDLAGHLSNLLGSPVNATVECTVAGLVVRAHAVSG